MIDKKSCCECKFFIKERSPEFDRCTLGLSVTNVRELPYTCSSFKPKPKVAITAEMLGSMAHDMATEAFYDRVDWRVGNTPMYLYPKVEKALRKWFKELGVEVVEK